jgi:MotA/TolQ/ExbB proton channel family
VNARLTFLSHFVIVLACAGVGFFAWTNGVLLQGTQEPVVAGVAATIGALFISGVIWLGWQAWIVDNEDGAEGDASYGDYLILIFPAIGLVGTVSGLGVVFAHLGDQAALAVGGAQAFYSARFGIVAMILIATLSYSLERGIKRAKG